MKHLLKILPEYFVAVQIGLKKSELRINDRDFKAGDKVILREFKDDYTGESIEVIITHVLKRVMGMHKDYCIFSFKIRT